MLIIPCIGCLLLLALLGAGLFCLLLLFNMLPVIINRLLCGKCPYSCAYQLECNQRKTDSCID